MLIPELPYSLFVRIKAFLPEKPFHPFFGGKKVFPETYCTSSKKKDGQ